MTHPIAEPCNEAVPRAHFDAQVEGLATKDLGID
jgi:hypothetical protein